jgi:hypothetical protein
MPQDAAEHDRAPDRVAMRRTAYLRTGPHRTGPLATTLTAMDALPEFTNAEMAQLVEVLEARGLIEVYVGDDGREVYRLTEEGVRLGNMLAMVEGDDADLVLRSLLSAEGEG